MMHVTSRMLFVEFMTGTAMLDVMSTSETSTVASESDTADGIEDRKLVPVAKNQAGRMRQHIIQPDHFVKARRGSNRPVVILGSNPLVSYG
jgi:hypothetical protein